MTLVTGFGNEEPFITEWLENYDSRVPDPADFALVNRVLLLRSKTGIGIDIALGALPFEEVAVGRAVKVEMEIEPGAKLQLCTAEDLIVMKAFADRPQDRLDLRGILVRQGTEALDWHYVWKCLTPLAVAKESPTILSHLQALREEVHQGETS